MGVDSKSWCQRKTRLLGCHYTIFGTCYGVVYGLFKNYVNFPYEYVLRTYMYSYLSGGHVSVS